MRNRLLSFILVVIVLFSVNSTIAYACDEQQTATYLGQLLFGNNAARWSSYDKMVMLVDALYICSEQADGKGQDKLDFLKNHKVSGIPSLASINIQSNQLLDYAHHSWTYVAPGNTKSQATRKTVLKNTVNTVFGTDIIDDTFGSLFGNAKKTKYESFAALLYYAHILFDYLADDPNDTAAFVRGYSISSYSGSAYTEVNGNNPAFSRNERNSTESFRYYSQLDAQGRAGVAFVNVCSDTMPPASSRPQIGMIRPSGWNQRTYPGLVNSKPPYLFNRCHLVAHQLDGNDTTVNLITGTRYLNETGMIPFENQVAEYASTHPGNHVLYRATPVYNGNNQVASGIQLEAYSVEDHGEGVCFNVYCYNVQPGVDIDYTDGTSTEADMTYNTSNILPFAIYDANDANPDLIYEINKHLAILFADQSSSGTYIAMMDQLDAIAIEARDNGYYNDRTVEKYIEAKQIQYRYFQVLRAYVPLLLANEDFFQSVFK